MSSVIWVYLEEVLNLDGLGPALTADLWRYLSLYRAGTQLPASFIRLISTEPSVLPPRV